MATAPYPTIIVGLMMNQGKYLLLLALILSITAISALAYKDNAFLKENYGATIETQTFSTSHKLGSTPHLSQKHVPTLFGHETAEILSKAKEQKIPETRLKLILKGTFTHQEEDKASALIAEVNKDASRYYVGDQILENAKLVSVNSGEIVLRRNGQDELLKLPILNGKREKNTQNHRQINRTSINHSVSPQKTATVSNQKSQSLSKHQQKLKERLARLRDNNRAKK